MNQQISLDKNNSSFSFHCTEKEMKIFAQQLAQRIRIFPEAGEVIFLDGEVGSGKTTFSRYFSEFLNIESSSPTYSIIEQRQNLEQNIEIIHGDFYRASQERSEEILEEYIENKPAENIQKIFLLEWLSEECKIDFFLEFPAIHLYFSHTDTIKQRKISIEFLNPNSCSVLNAKALQKEYKTPVHVQEHIELVRKIAMFCAKKLQQQNIPIDIELVESGAILHDAVRYVDFPLVTKEFEKYYKEILTDEKIQFWNILQKKYKTMHHAHAMQDILNELYYTATGRVVASHYTGEIFRKKEFSWEEKCVYYADKRALHHTFVTIEERLIDGAKRYPHEALKDNNIKEKIMDMEKNLQKFGRWNEEDIQEYLDFPPL